MRTTEEDAECRRLEQAFEDLRVRVSAQVEGAARRGAAAVVLEVADVRQLLHALAITPFKVMTVQEAADEALVWQHLCHSPATHVALAGSPDKERNAHAIALLR